MRKKVEEAKEAEEAKETEDEILVCFASTRSENPGDAPQTYGYALPTIRGDYSGVGDLFSALVLGHYKDQRSPDAAKEEKEGGSGSGSGRSISSSGIRPLPRIPSNSISPLEEYPVAGPSTSPITTSPIAVSPTYTFSSQKPAFSPSASAYYTPPPTARTMSAKGKQPDYGNATGTQTRPKRNGSGGSSHYKLQLHEVS